MQNAQVESSPLKVKCSTGHWEADLDQIDFVLYTFIPRDNTLPSATITLSIHEEDDDLILVINTDQTESSLYEDKQDSNHEQIQSKLAEIYEDDPKVHGSTYKGLIEILRETGFSQ